MASQQKHQIDQAIQAIVDAVTDKRSRRPSSRTRRQIDYSVRCLVKDSVGARSLDQSGLASITKRSNAYSRGRYNRHQSYRTHVLIAYQGMVDLEYLREVKRGASDGAIPIYRTRYSASDKLLELLGPMAPHEIAANLTVPPNEDPIRVQSKEKHRIEGKAEPAETKVRVEYQETALTTRMRRDIGIINDLLERTDLQLTGGKGHLASVDQEYPTDLSRKTLHRVFNDTTFKTGGRFYGGWWQSLPSEMRAAITIDGVLCRRHG